MSTSAIIGHLNADNTSANATFVHYDGYPEAILPTFDHQINIHGIETVVTATIANSWCEYSPNAFIKGSRITRINGWGSTYPDIETFTLPVDDALTPNCDVIDRHGAEWVYLFSHDTTALHIYYVDRHIETLPVADRATWDDVVPRVTLAAI